MNNIFTQIVGERLNFCFTEMRRPTCLGILQQTTGDPRSPLPLVGVLCGRPCFYAILFVHMLCGVELVVFAFLCDKFVMCATLCNALVVDIHYLIAVFDS